MKAHLRHVRIAPKKANLVAAMIRRMTVEEALITLKKLPKTGAQILYKVVHSAMANAEQNDGQQRKDLYIKELIVNRAAAFRRYVPMARGRSRPIDKFTSHITVKLGVVVPGEEKEKKGKGGKEKVKPSFASGSAKAKPVLSKGEGSDKKAPAGKKPLEAEKVEGPIAQAPGNPSKVIDSDDPHAGGSHEKQSTGTFTPHHHSSRGE